MVHGYVLHTKEIEDSVCYNFLSVLLPAYNITKKVNFVHFEKVKICLGTVLYLLTRT